MVSFILSLALAASLLVVGAAAQDQKVSSLSTVTTTSPTDRVYVVIDPLGTPLSKAVTIDSFFKSRTGNNSVTAYANSIATAVAAIGSSTQAVIEIPATTTVAASVTVTANIELTFTGSGSISVSSGQTLTIQSSTKDYPISQVFSGSGTVKLYGPNEDIYPQWFGGKIDGTDTGALDTPAIQKAIDCTKGVTNGPHPASVRITGGAFINNTLTITESSCVIRGNGWGTSNTAPYGGWIKWNGSAGLPMIKIYVAYGAGVDNVRLIGKSTAKPSAAIEVGTTGGGTNHNYFNRIWIGPMLGYDSDDAVQFDIGVLFSGTLDGDSNTFRDVVIYKCTTGIDVQNNNAGINDFQSLYVSNCTTGFKTVTLGQTGTGWTFLSNGVDINLAQTPATLNVRNYASENSGRLAVMADLTRLTVAGGFQAGGALHSDGFFIVSDCSSSSSVTLEDFTLYKSGGYPGANPKIKMRGTAQQYLTLRNVRNVDESDLDMGLVSGTDETGRRIIIYERDTEITEGGGGRQRVGVNILDYAHQTIDFSRNDLQTTQVIGNLGINRIASGYGIHALGGSQRLGAITDPGPPTFLSVNGTPGASTHTYYVVARDSAGNKSNASTALTVTTANATINSTNSVSMYVDPQPGWASVDILKDATNALMTNVDVSKGIRVFITDTGTATSGYTAPGYNATANLTIDGRMFFGGETSASPMLFRSGASLQLYLGDGSGKADWYANLGVFDGAVTVGGGTAIAKVLSATATLDFGSTAAQTSSDLTITATGAAVGDVVSLGVPNAAILANSSFSAWVSASNTVTVRFNNHSSSAKDPASAAFRVMVSKF